jgi:ribosome-associated heat shock protein Hsp15
VSDPGKEVRIDRWLWAARLYKTRSQAAAAVKSGHVQVEGQRAKASRIIRIGDRVRVNRHAWRMEIVVTGLSGNRGPARTAAQLYEETPESIERRALEREGRRIERAAVPEGRPDKKARRELRRLAGRD